MPVLALQLNWPDIPNIISALALQEKILLYFQKAHAPEHRWHSAAHLLDLAFSHNSDPHRISSGIDRHEPVIWRDASLIIMSQIGGLS
jgi:hypothetical protein